MAVTKAYEEVSLTSVAAGNDHGEAVVAFAHPRHARARVADSTWSREKTERLSNAEKSRNWTTTHTSNT